jgi:tetratricopeptide (TPR) repeat protein
MAEVAGQLRGVYAELVGRPYLRDVEGTSRAECGSRLASLNNRAVSLIELGRFKEAADLLRQGLVDAAREQTAYPTEITRQNLAYNLALLKVRWNHVRLLADADAGLPAEGNVHRGSYLEGLLLLETGELYDAIDRLGAALGQEGATSADVLNARGIGLLLVGETQPALRSFAAAWKLVPDRLDIARNLGLAYYYDGQAPKALRIFETIAGRTVFDAEDAVRHATVLAACGATDQALEQVRAAFSMEYRSSCVLLTSAELLVGAQTFLPGATPLTTATDTACAWVQQVAAAEPYNLRARIDEETFPSRYGYLLGVFLRNGRRELVSTSSPARLGGCIASSYRPLTKRFRWGDLPDRNARGRLVCIAALPALLLAIVCGIALGRGVWPDTAWYAGLILLGATVFTMGRPPCNDLAREIAFLTPLAVLPVLGAVSLMDKLATRGTSTTLWLIPPLALAAFTVWQIPLQRLICRARAFPNEPPVALVLNLFQKRDRSSVPFSWRYSCSIWLRVLRQRFRTLPVAALMGWRRLNASFRTWQICLLPQVISLALLAWYLGIEEGMGVYLPFLTMPLTFALLSPRVMLWLNAPASVCIGVVTYAAIMASSRGVELKEVESLLVELDGPSQLGCLCFGAGFLFLNWLAARRCPDLAAEWTTCDPSPWDIHQMVDPLNIRLYAAPWQLSQIGSDAEGSKKPRE